MRVTETLHDISVKDLGIHPVPFRPAVSIDMTHTNIIISSFLLALLLTCVYIATPVGKSIQGKACSLVSLLLLSAGVSLSIAVFIVFVLLANDVIL